MGRCQNLPQHETAFPTPSRLNPTHLTPRIYRKILAWPAHGGLLSLEKTFVENGTSGSYNASTGEVVEVQEYDRLKSIQIKSKLISYPSSREIPMKYSFSFPDELLSAVFRGIWAAADGKLAYDVSLQMDLRRGYRGPCDAVLHEIFTTNPDSVEIPSITKFFPQGHRILGAWAGVLNGNPHAQIRDFIIPESLHPAIDPTPLTPPSEPDDIFFSDIPATTPTAVPWGDEICVEVPDREPWRGISIVRYVMMTCPSL